MKPSPVAGLFSSVPVIEYDSGDPNVAAPHPSYCGARPGCSPAIMTFPAGPVVVSRTPDQQRCRVIARWWNAAAGKWSLLLESIARSAGFWRAWMDEDLKMWEPETEETTR